MDRYRILRLAVVAALCWGSGHILAQKPSGSTQSGPMKRMTHAERKAAAKRAKQARAKRGLPDTPPAPGKGGRHEAGPGRMAVTGAAAAVTPGPGTTADYFGVYPNYANSPMPKGSLAATITITNGGAGYTSAPAVTIGDAYNTGANATATASFDAATGAVTAVTLGSAGANYTAPVVTIAPPACTINGTTCNVATAQAALDAATVTGGIRKFVDSLPGLNLAGANNLGQYIPVAIPDTSTYSGSDYYEIELGEYTEQMHSDLPPTRLRGYRQTNTSDANVSTFHYLGPLIIARRDVPVRIKFTNNLPTGAGGNLFLPVDTTYMGAGAGPNGGTFSQNRATLHLHGGVTPWISDGTTHQWITPAAEGTSYPNGVSVYGVPDMPQPGKPGDAGHPLGSGSMTFYYTNQQSARLMFYHDHAYGITRLNVYAGEAAGYLLQDPVEQDLVARGVIPADQIPLVIQDKTFIDTNTIASQDPTWPFTPVAGNLWLPHVYMTNQNPYDMSGANPMGRWDYGPWFWPPFTGLTYGAIANPYYDPACNPATAGYCEPPQIPGTPDGRLISPSGVPESFMDTPVINGTAYPKLTVQPKAYRFRILNAADDRFWNLSLWKADTTVPQGCPTCAPNSEVKMVAFDSSYAGGFPASWGTNDNRVGGVPDPKTAGPNMIQIGTEGGFLPAPVVIPNRPVNFDYNRRSIVVLNVLEKALFLGPAERADVIIDFSQFAGQDLILYNDAPAPVPAFDPRIDYYTGHPDMSLGGDGTGGTPTTLAGFGPNTRTIMQIHVAAGTPVPFSLPALQSALPAAFAQSQEQIIVPQAAYNPVYNTAVVNTPGVNFSRIQDTSMTFQPMGQNATLTFEMEPKAIIEDFQMDYGRMNAILGVEVKHTNITNQTSIIQTYNDPPTEVVKVSDPALTPIGSAADGTQIWKLTHNGVDTHAVHFHMFHVQVINRVGWDGAIKPPDSNELGWKDTVRMNPLEDIIVALRPIQLRNLPFKVPNSFRPLAPALPLGSTVGFTNVDPNGNPITPGIVNSVQNFGWEYVWHCHLLGHEENDMMRALVVAVPPETPSNLVAAANTVTNQTTLTWTDNSATATGFTIEYATTPTGAFSTLATVGAVTTYTHAAYNPSYVYRVYALNTVGSNVPNYPTQTAVSQYSNTAAPLVIPPVPATLTAVLQDGPQVLLSWTESAGAVTGYAIERSDNGGAFVQIAAPATTATGPMTYTDATNVLPGNSYTYRVKALNSVVSSNYSNTATVNVPPVAPTGLTATVQNGQVVLSWTDNSANETGFEIQRQLGNGAFTTIATAPAHTGTGTVNFTDTTAVGGNTYTYQVRAITAAAQSTWSNMAVAAIPAPAPTNLTATAQSGTQVLLSWTDNATTETGFVIQRSANGGPYTQIATPGPRTGTGNVTYTDTTVTAGNTYSYQVAAIAPGGQSAWSNTATVSTATAPAAPSGLTGTVQAGPQVLLSFTDNADNETGFQIQRSVNGGAYTQVAAPAAAAGTGSTVTWTDTALGAGGSIAYRVRAVNATGNSAWVTVTVTVTAAPVAPTNLTAVYQGGSVTLTWRDNANNETGFVVQRSDNGGAFAQIAAPGPRTGTGTVTYTDSTVTAGNTYTYQVQAVNAAGGSAWSNQATATTSAPPAAPSNLAGALAAGPQIQLSWTDNANNETGFSLERSLNGGAFAAIAAPGAAAGTGTTVTYADTAVSAGNSYSYRVRATNATGNSGYSNTVTVAVPAATPAAPSNVSVGQPGGPGTAVRVSFTDNATNETGFVVQQSLDGTNWVQVAAPLNLPGTGRVGRANIPLGTGGAIVGQPNYFRVQAVNAAGGSAWVQAPGTITPQ